jgi:hypothetical protein
LAEGSDARVVLPEVLGEGTSLLALVAGGEVIAKFQHSKHPQPAFASDWPLALPTALPEVPMMIDT